MNNSDTSEPTIAKHFSGEALHYLASLYREFDNDIEAYCEMTGAHYDDFDADSEDEIDAIRTTLYEMFDAIRLENGNLLVPNNIN